ncbi:MAG: very short patch repair endonuclease [Thermodesulfovibrionales bacterium]|nr:very short patch repair endonuclease [Thermodesulfovibrionales bacterium]
MDTFSKTERSRIMASVKSRDAKSTELNFVSLLKEKGIAGWRRNYPLTGKPDFVFSKFKIAVFIDGCFWHGCPRHCRMPSSNVNYWNNKIEKNKIRDKQITKALKMKGWQVIRIWEHEIKTGKLNRKLRQIKIAQQNIPGDGE